MNPDSAPYRLIRRPITNGVVAAKSSRKMEIFTDGLLMDRAVYADPKRSTPVNRTAQSNNYQTATLIQKLNLLTLHL